MKPVDAANAANSNGRQLKAGDRFLFRCHPGVTCFNLCCRNLNLFLYPYDVARLRSALGMTSGDFLDAHVDVIYRPGLHFPSVLLKMADNDEFTCPFLTDAGCTVYADRPDACRTFPVEHGVMYDSAGMPSDVHFFKPPDFCQGQHETQEWNIAGWAKDQDAVIYNRMTRAWGDVQSLFLTDPWGVEGKEGRKAKMAFMATYNLDAFRSFVLESSFLTRYKLKADVKRAIKNDDVALMKVGFDWVKMVVWNQPSKIIRLR